MDYVQTVDFLFRSLPQFQRIGMAAYKSNLDNTLKLDSHLSHPHTTFKTIHVGGTNGKGSVSTLLYNTLREAGYSVGLYTSPHMFDFRERIEVNGEKISEQDVVDFVENNYKMIKNIAPSFFEMTVAMAFDHFRNKKVDVAIIEVGMGGRLDSTNIISPILSIITNISKDHTQFLGSTNQLIAVEKAGIIKVQTPIVIGQTQTDIQSVFLAQAEKLDAPITFADSIYKCSSVEKNVYTVQDLRADTQRSFKLLMQGNYQRLNICTALAALDILKENFTITDKNIDSGFSKSHIAGRWEIINHAPLTICDTAHNINGISMAIEQILQQPYKKLFMILGFSQDKDITPILNVLPRKAHYIFTQASVPRAMSCDNLLSKATDSGLEGEALPNVEIAYKKAVSLATEKDMIFIGGSLFLVADFLHTLNNTNDNDLL